MEFAASSEPLPDGEVKLRFDFACDGGAVTDVGPSSNYTPQRASGGQQNLR